MADTKRSTVLLSDVTSMIRSGVHFRGSPPTASSGDVRFVRLRNVDYESETVDWESCPWLSSEDAPEQRLQTRDILLSRRGKHRVAFQTDDLPGPAVADTPFFVISPDTNRIVPAFLAWQINSSHAQHWLARHAQGSGMSMLQKNDLQRLPLVLPDLKVQRRLMEANRLMRREKQLLKELQECHETLIRGLFQQYTALQAQ